MKLVYMKLMQQELDQIRCTWNSHRIRTNPTTDPVGRPFGRPDILYYITDGHYIKDYCQNCSTEDFRGSLRRILLRNTKKVIYLYR